MSTQNENPISDLMEGLGIDDGSTTDAPSKDENFDQGSGDPTLTDGEVPDNSGEKDTPDGDTKPTDDAAELLKRIEALESEKVITDKRLADKDKYINELKNGKSNEGKQDEEESQADGWRQDENEEVDFWDDPEGNYKNLQKQLAEANAKINATNFRLDEDAFAREVPDYYKVVNAKDVADVQQDPEFVKGFQEAENKFDYAYKFLKGRAETKTSSEDDIREQIRKEERERILKEHNIKGAPDDIPPSIASLGSGEAGSTQAKSTDGFMDVFGQEG